MSSPRNWRQDPRLNDHGYLWQLMSPDELADEVMTLRAQLQAMTNERNNAQNALETTAKEQVILLDKIYAERDFWKREAEMWHTSYVELITKLRGIL